MNRFVRSTLVGTFTLLSLLSTAPAVSTQETAPMPEALATPDGFGVRSADGSFVLRLRGGIQYDGRLFAEDPNESLVNQFQIRRARADITGTLYQDYDFRIFVDFAGSRVELLDAYGNLRLTPALQVRVGKMKGPVGLERLQSGFSNLFAERAFPTALVPNRDIGVQLHGVLGGGTAEYQLGLFNGVPDGGSADGDDGDSKDIAARVFVTPFGATDIPAIRGLGVGIAATSGEQNGTAALPALAPYRTAGREIFFRYRNDGSAAGTAAAQGRRTRISPQASWFFKGIGALAEYVSVRQSVTRNGTVAELTNTAWQTTASLVLTGENATFRGVIPARDFDLGEGRWGAVQLVARVNKLSVDEESFPLYSNPDHAAQEALGLGAGLNWHLNRAVLLLVNYEHTEFAAAPGGAVRDDENVLVGRVQVTF